MSSRPPAPLPNARLPEPPETLAGKYRLERTLGRGGMGVVYLAHHELLGRHVAVKLMLPEIARNPEAVARFLNEARAAARIQNEHVARVMDVGTLESGLPYIVMEYLRGADLGDQLARNGPLPVEMAVDYVLQALEAIAEAHAAGIVHRDLKPSNLFVAVGEDGAPRVKVLDFGISKAGAPADAAVSPSLTSTSAVLGSPYYMSPEQLRSSRDVDARADIWAIGVILYELLSAKLPYRGDTLGALFASILEDPPQPLRKTRPEIPASLEDVILLCLRRKRDERWRSVTVLARALAPFGSQAGARSAERVTRILPDAHLPHVYGQGSGRPPGPSSAPGEPSPAPAAATGSRTAASWQSDVGGMRRLRRRVKWTLAALAVCAAGALAVAVVLVRGGRAGGAAAGASTLASTPVASYGAPSAAEAPTAATPATASAPSASTASAPAPSAATVATAATATSSAPARAAAAPPAGPTRRSLPGRAPGAATASSTAIDTILDRH